MAAKKVSDEQITAALLTTGTIKAAAAAVGISERTIYDRMNDGEFQAVYKAAKADLMRATVSKINGQLQAAVDTIAEIMTDKENSAATRLQAAQAILNNAGKFMQRLQADENETRKQINKNEYGLFSGIFDD